MSDLSATMPAAKIARAEFHSSADVDLMKRIATGNEDAFTQLVLVHGDDLAQTIGRLTGWSRDADDILQDVFITVWQKAGQYNGSGSLASWLKRIAINRCRNQFRLTHSIQRKLEGFAQWLGGRQLGSRQTSHGKIDSQPDGTGDQIQSALARLSPDDRALLVLYYLEEMSGNEVADVLEISVPAVHVRLHRARTRLKKILKDENSPSH